MQKKFFVALVFMLTVIFSVAENVADARYLAERNFAEEVLYYVNLEREKVGVKPLTLSTPLMQAAAVRAGELPENFSHTRPDGSDCFTAVKTSYRTIGENIAAGQRTPEDVVDSWMNSQGHRENILNPDFGKIGIGYFYAPNSHYAHYWVQIFTN